MITEVRVRKQMQESGIPRYRTEIGRKNVNYKQLASFEAVRFIYTSTMSSGDIERFNGRIKNYYRPINIIQEEN